VELNQSDYKDMIKKIKLITEANKINMNGFIYSDEIMECIVKCLNRLKFIPVVVNINSDEYFSPTVGRVIPRTSVFDGKSIYLEIDIEDHIDHMVGSNEYIFDSYINAKLDGNQVVYCPDFDVIGIQIIKNMRRDK